MVLFSLFSCLIKEFTFINRKHFLLLLFVCLWIELCTCSWLIIYLWLCFCDHMLPVTSVYFLKYFLWTQIFAKSIIWKVVLAELFGSNGMVLLTETCVSDHHIP